MRRLVPITLALALPVCGHAQPTITAAHASTSQPAPAPWLLAFDGKSTNQLALDRRFPVFLRTHISSHPIQYWIDKPTIPGKDAIEFLHGPPDDVHVADGRYVTASACVAHDALDCGLLWVNTQTGATVFGASVFRVPPPIAANSAHLWLFSNTRLDPKALPPTLTSAIAQWSAHTNGDNSHTLITDITLVQPSGTELRLSRDDAHTWQPTNTAPAGK